jgi:asparagine synthase (glutamine-hydrolysing)
MGGALAQSLPYSARGKNYLWMISRPSAIERYWESNYAPRAMRQQMLEPDWLLDTNEATLRAGFPHAWLAPGADIVAQAMHFETAANLTGGMLVKTDRMSMAASLEVRCPLLDHRLAEWAIPLAHRWKLRGGRGKYILLRALGDRLPPELLNRPKMGFTFPLEQWFRGPLRPMIEDYLGSRSFRERGIASPQFVAGMLAEHQSGRRDNSAWLWCLLVLELWYRQQAEVPVAGKALVC